MILWTSFGIRTRLFVAFGAVAAMTVAASIAAWLSFANLSESLSRIANTHVPAMTVAAQLAEKGGAIIATAPALMSAGNETEQQAIWTDLEILLIDMSDLLEEMGEQLTDEPSRASLQRLTEGISDNLGALNANVDNRFDLRNRNAELTDHLRWLHADFLDEVEPMIEEARFNIQSAMEEVEEPVGEEIGLAETKTLRAEMLKREALLKINAAGNLAVGLLIRASSAESVDEVDFSGHLIGDITDGLDEDLGVLQGLDSSVSLRQVVAEILVLASGGGSVLDVRKRELGVVQEGRRLLAANNQLVDHLKSVIGGQVSALESATTMAAATSNRSIQRGRYFLAVIAMVSLLIAVAVGWIYVGRNIVARITALGKSMRAIADGDLKTAVPVEGRDEISEMAQALLVFRDTAIEVEEANAEAIIDNTMAGVVGVSRSGVIEFFNPSAEELFGRAADKVIGKNLTTLIAHENRGSVEDILRGSGKPPAYVETNGLRVDGATFPMDMAVREFRQRRRKRFMVTLHDMTERKHAQQLLEQRVLEKTKDLRSANRKLRKEITERERTALELREAQDELVQASKLAALGQISAGIAHELNQPLAAIRSYAHNGSILLDRGRESETRENLERIEAMTERMADITSHLKSIARRPSKLVGTVNLETAVTNALSFFRTRIEKEAVDVELDFSPKDVLTTGEDVRLEQVFINLVTNALDAMEDAPVKKLCIAAKNVDGKAVVEFRDTGHGILEEDVGKIFDPFFTTKEAGSGLGLGLSISSKIIRDFGGVIQLRETSAEGTLIAVELSAAE
ncbi:MAG: PAS domain S-box protein [Rhodospirillales bacterium]|nr:PAS domain S-box protein [Rhodospirillales bacterium]